MSPCELEYLESEAKIDRLDALLALVQVNHPKDPARLVREMEAERRRLEARRPGAKVRDSREEVEAKLRAIGLGG